MGKWHIDTNCNTQCTQYTCTCNLIVRERRRKVQGGRGEDGEGRKEGWTRGKGGGWRGEEREVDRDKQKIENISVSCGNKQNTEGCVCMQTEKHIGDTQQHQDHTQLQLYNMYKEQIQPTLRKRSKLGA